MNAYLAEVVKAREEIAEQKARRELKLTVASKLLETGKMTIDEIASVTELELTEVTNLAHIFKGDTEKVNPYLIEVIEAREKFAEQRGAHKAQLSIASRLLETEKMTIYEIASLTNLELAEL